MVFVVSCLASIIYSTPFTVLDQGNEADPFDNSLYFTSTDQTLGDESVSNSIAVGSATESLLEGDMTMWQDSPDPEFEMSLQPLDTYATDIVATSPSKSALHYDDEALI